jgi:hypothetical protein
MRFKIIIIIVLHFLLFSCYEQILVINQDDTSGTLNFRIDYLKEFESLIQYISDKHDIDLNTSALFDRNLGKMISLDKNTNLLQQKIETKDNLRSSDVLLSLNDITQLPKMLPVDYFPINISIENRLVYCKTSLSLLDIGGSKNIKLIYQDLNSDEKELINSYTAIIPLKFVFKTTKPILTANRGQLSKDKKVLIFETTLYQLLNIRDDQFEIVFSYRK